MTDLARDVGQLLWLGFHGTTAPAQLLSAIGAGEVGAVVVFKRNLVTESVGGVLAGRTVAEEVIDLAALVELHGALHAAAPADAPVLIAIDQEGGSVQRVRAPATRWPPMLAHDAFAPPVDEALATDVGRALGEELAALGVDIDFAPVLDIHTNPDNPVIGDRAFGRDAETVVRRALAFARGLESSGVLPCGKHFPGHGDTATDSHLELPRIDHPRERLDAVELFPFARAAREGLPMIMTAHVVFGAIDPSVPATLSPKVVRDVLREEMDYKGVIVSDDLDMKAIVNHFGVGEAAVRAVRAGCDSLLVCEDERHQEEARAALIAAAESDSDFRARVAESAARIRSLATLSRRSHAAAGVLGLDVIGSPDHRLVADRLAGRATVV